MHFSDNRNQPNSVFSIDNKLIAGNADTAGTININNVEANNAVLQMTGTCKLSNEIECFDTLNGMKKHSKMLTARAAPNATTEVTPAVSVEYNFPPSGESSIYANINLNQNLSMENNVFKVSFSEDLSIESMPTELKLNKTSNCVDSPISREFTNLQGSANDCKVLPEYASETNSLNSSPIRKETMLRARSRSKSVNSKSPDNSETNGVKKWPSEERIICKRSNMRSENNEFVQKQMNFLHRVFHLPDEKDDNQTELLCSKNKSPQPAEPINNSIQQNAKERNLYKRTQYLRAVTTQPRTASQDSESMIVNHSEQREILQHSPELTTSENADDISVIESTTAISGIDGASSTDTTSLEARLQANWHQPPKEGSDSYCWKCHRNGVTISCSKCVRSYHTTCARVSLVSLVAIDVWICNECIMIENSIINPKKYITSRRNELSTDMLNQLLSFALKRMCYVKGQIDFRMPYEEETSYLKYMANPITFTSLAEKINRKVFRSADEFLSETKWFIHNAYILSKGSSELTIIAKCIVKTCRQETMEIDTCAECYLNANSRSDWFVEVCTQPHLLLWAKLKGFPFWPAKSMGVNNNSLVKVRFFGEHDRAFVPVKDCYLYSKQHPNTYTGRRSAKELADCIKEVDIHIERIRAKIGNFQYAPYKIPYDPNDELYQLEMMIPGVQEFIRKQQQVLNLKPPLQFKIYKTADNNLSIIQKANTPEQNILDTVGEIENTSSIVLNKKSSDEKEVDEYDSLYECNEEQDAPKYEVVSKLNSDDSNSSKLSTVILKRKSNQLMNNNRSSGNNEQQQTAAKKLITNEEVDIFTTKTLTNKTNNGKYIPQECDKREDLNISMPTSNVKRKFNEVNSLCDDNPKIKQSRVDKFNKKDFPVVTIVSGSNVLNASINQREIIKPRKIIGPKSVSRRRKNDKVIKMKNGINIKKNNMNRRGSSLISSLKNTKQKIAESEENSTINDNNPPLPIGKDKTPEKTQRKDDNEINDIIKNCVPFVEIKQEIISGEEDVSSDVCIDENCEVMKNVAQPHIESGNDVALNINASKLMYVKQEALFDNEITEHTSIQDLDAIPLLTDDQVLQQPDCNLRHLMGSTTIQRISNNCNEDVSLGNYGAKSTNFSGASNIDLKNTEQNYLGLSSSDVKPNTSKRLQLSKNHSTLNMDKQCLAPIATGNKRKTGKSLHSAMNIMPSTTDGGETLVKRKSPNIPKTFSVHSSSKNFDQRRIPNKTTMVSIPIDSAPTSEALNYLYPTTGSANEASIPPLITMTTASSAAIINTNLEVVAKISASPSCVSSSSSMVVTSAVSSANMSTVSNAFVSTTATVSSTAIVSTLSTISTNYVVAQGQKTICPSAKTGTAANSNSLALTAPPPLAGLSTGSLSAIRGSLNTNGIQKNLPTSSNSAPTHLMGTSITPAMASAISDIICRAPPKLINRPLGPLKSQGAMMPPSQAGPVCSKLVDNAHKITDFFISVMEDTLSDFAQDEDLHAKVVLLTMELERFKKAHDIEVAELKKNADMLLSEMRKSMEMERTRITNEVRKQCEEERIRAIEETKRKQWCSQCGQEANLYCCWNTSYCDYPCQQLHWAKHAINCAQSQSSCATEEATTSTDRTKSPMASTSSSKSTSRKNTSSNNVAVAAAQTSIGFNAISHQQERQQPTIITNISSAANVSNILLSQGRAVNTIQKKDKNLAKVSEVVHQNATTMKPTSHHSTEVLKLPTNTYLRPITNPATLQNVSNTNILCNPSYSIPLQRFNVALPITTPPINSGALPAYTILQQNNNWMVNNTQSVTTNTCNSVVSSLSAGYMPPISISNPPISGTNHPHAMTVKTSSNKNQSRQRINMSQIKYF